MTSQNYLTLQGNSILKEDSVPVVVTQSTFKQFYKLYLTLCLRMEINFLLLFQFNSIIINYNRFTLIRLLLKHFFFEF